MCDARSSSCVAQRRWGADHIAHEVGHAASTVQRILNSEGLGRLDSGDRATAATQVRSLSTRIGPVSWSMSTSRSSPAIPDGGGWRHPWPRPSTSHKKRTSTGYRFIHTALDDRTRLVYSEILDDETSHHRRWVLATSRALVRRTTASPSNGSSPTTAPATDHAPGAAALRRDRHDTTNTPAPTGPRPTARSNASTASCSRNGPTSEPGHQTDERHHRLRRLHALLQSPPITRRTRLGNHPPTPSGTTSPPSTTSEHGRNHDAQGRPPHGGEALQTVREGR